MPPYEKEEPNKGEVWVPKRSPAIAQVLQKRIFEGETEFPVDTIVAYKLAQFTVRSMTRVARFNGERWEITGDSHGVSTVDLLEILKSPAILKIWLLEDGATIYEKEEF